MQRGRDSGPSQYNCQLCPSCHRARRLATVDTMASHCDSVLCPPCQRQQRGRAISRPVTSYPHRKLLGPAFCAVQVAASIFITIFIMGLPLGDPKVRCAEKTSHGCSGTEISKCFVCYLYNVLLSLSYQLTELFDYLQRGVISCLVNLYTETKAFLHELKLQMYQVLQHIDNKDYCKACNLTCVGKKESRADVNSKSHQSVSKSDKKILVLCDNCV